MRIELRKKPGLIIYFAMLSAIIFYLILTPYYIVTIFPEFSIGIIAYTSISCGVTLYVIHRSRKNSKYALFLMNPLVVLHASYPLSTLLSIAYWFVAGILGGCLILLSEEEKEVKIPLQSV